MSWGLDTSPTVDSEAMDSAIPIPIPIPARACAAPMAAACEEARGSFSIPRALIVDDCRFIAERVARALEAKGLECTVAGDGFAGLELLRSRRFDLFVLDVDMPFVDGFSVLRQLRCDPIHAETPVLMLAARHSEADHDRAIELGASGYMSKPLQLRPLNAMVDAMMY